MRRRSRRRARWSSEERLQQIELEKPLAQRLAAAQSRLAKANKASEASKGRILELDRRVAAARNAQLALEAEQEAAKEAEADMRAQVAFSAIGPESPKAPMPQWLMRFWEEVREGKVSVEQAFPLHAILVREKFGGDEALEVSDESMAGEPPDLGQVSEVGDAGVRPGSVGRDGSAARDRHASRSPRRDASPNPLSPSRACR